jgi:hypothetical protein
MRLEQHFETKNNGTTMSGTNLQASNNLVPITRISNQAC